MIIRNVSLFPMPQSSKNLQTDPAAKSHRETDPGEARTHSWWVYIILASDQSLYTGITTDVARRFQQHASGLGAKYFRGRRPVKVVYRAAFACRSSASKEEAHIKGMNRRAKLRLIQQGTPSDHM